MVNRSLVQLYETYIAGLQLRDVKDVDKQDDGAARRMFHSMALRAMTRETKPGVPEVLEHFKGLFVYLFILGELFSSLYRHISNRGRFQANYLMPG